MPAADDAMNSMIRSLEEKTGKPLDWWVKTAKASGGSKHGELVKFLKAEHELTHGYANLVALTVLQSAAVHADGEDLVEAQYSGAKAALRPIYDKLLSTIQGFGSDIEIAPKKGYVSVRRKKQFAILQPSTATRFDVGINLKGVPPAGRLEESGSFNQMVSHRVRVASAADVDKELTGWLKRAYESA
jgi:hypothetical protein